MRPGDHCEQAQKSRSQAAANDGPQQPANVEAGRAQHRVNRIAIGTLQPTAIHAVVELGVADGRLDRLATLQPTPLQWREALALAAMDEGRRRHFHVDAAESEIDRAGRY